ncbi:unnamed protein product [Effrenium voratum]|uniref:Uncharacterized protein n=1 Tax=Effrenium voratum TaxID=2562239 RepID=A0AA36IEI1_9DINO|nr:unnamed protein product [Effrenium voratum]CAJ1440430.1 unnamed protein product [Effrenium voratum]
MQVALQLQSLEGYCSSVGHILWDLHSSDVLINKRGDETKLIVMDAYMAPDENTGCRWTLPPELVQGGPIRMQLGKTWQDMARHGKTGEV